MDTFIAKKPGGSLCIKCCDNTNVDQALKAITDCDKDIVEITDMNGYILWTKKGNKYEPIRITLIDVCDQVYSITLSRERVQSIVNGLAIEYKIKATV